MKKTLIALAAVAYHSADDYIGFSNLGSFATRLS